jgi:hypothetical protein
VVPTGWTDTPEAGDVSARLIELSDEAARDRIAHVRKDDRDRPRLPLDSNGRRGPVCEDDVGLQADQLLRERSYPIVVTAAPTKVHPHVATIGPTQVRKRLKRDRHLGIRPVPQLNTWPVAPMQQPVKVVLL